MIIYENKNKGFTIIELIVVISIIAVLASIIVVNVNQYIQKSKIAATKGEINQIAKAMELYRINHGCLPGGLDECQFGGDSPGDYNSPDQGDFGSKTNWQNQWTTLANKLVDDKLIGGGNLLYDDAWGNPYVYDKNDTDNGCSPVWSVGPNGVNDSGWTVDQYN